MKRTKKQQKNVVGDKQFAFLLLAYILKQTFCSHLRIEICLSFYPIWVEISWKSVTTQELPTMCKEFLLFNTTNYFRYLHSWINSISACRETFDFKRKQVNGQTCLLAERLRKTLGVNVFQDTVFFRSSIRKVKAKLVDKNGYQWSEDSRRIAKVPNHETSIVQ